MSIRTHIITLALAAIAAACASHDEPLTADAAQAPCTCLSIEAGISNGSTVESRAMVANTTAKAFATDATIGIFVSRHGSPHTTPFSPKMINMRGVKQNSNTKPWKFNYEAKTVQFNDIYIIGDRLDPATADIYAYAPYQAGLTSLAAIPFSMSTGAAAQDYNAQTDILWAVENAHATQNKDIAPGKVVNGVEMIDNKAIPLTFKHLLARLRFRIRLTGNAHSARVDVNRIVFSTIGNRLPLYTAGTYSAIDGTIAPTTQAETVTRSMASNNNGSNVTTTSYRDFNMTFVPAQPDASLPGDTPLLHADIYLNSSVTPTYVLTITKAMLMHSDGTTCGLQSGCTYTFCFTVENYLHLEKVIVDTEWSEGQSQEIMI